MYRVVWCVALFVAAATGTTCPSSCTCSETSAVCDDLETFDARITTLRLVNPKTVVHLDGLAERGFRHLNKLVIERAIVGSIQKGAFKGLDDLATVKIVDSLLPDVDNDTFADCGSLRTVTFAGSQFGSFQIVSSTIEELDLSNCSLSVVPNLDGLTELVYLNLAHNALEEIGSGAFYNLINLEEGNLSHNRLRKLPTDLFSNNTQLNTLDLSHNPLESFSFGAPSELEKLLLKSCKLTQLDETIGKNLELLDYLDVSHNNISEVSPDTFVKLADLEVLDLSHNNLRYIPPDAFRENYKLQKIILDDNSLKTLPPFTTSMDGFRTTYFSCNNCHLKLLTEETFNRMPVLSVLRLARNKLEKAHFLKRLPELSEVDLSYNYIRSFDESEFGNNPSLESVNVAGNLLSELNPQIFKNNPLLTKLNASSCELKKLWSVADGKYKLQALKEFSVKNNKIQAISLEDLVLLPKLAVFAIEGNPLACGEVFCNLIEFLNDHDIMQTAASSETTLNAIYDFEIKNSSWAGVVKSSCGVADTCDYEYDSDGSDYGDDEEDLKDDGKEETELEITEIEEERVEEESGSFMRRYSILWPAFVFMTTALLVVLIVANVTLLIFRRRRGQLQMEGLPQFKIIPWTSNNKLKKHSGSVYQPLSEDKTGGKTPVIGRRYEQVPTAPEVHKAIP